MKNRYYFIAAFFIIFIIIIWLSQNNHSLRVDKNLFRNTTNIILTKHARCRMDCRHINKEEINEIIHTGNVNSSKSRTGSKGDEIYALEGYSNEHQHLRVVVAPENDGLVVITCIDLDKEWPCNCN